MSSFENLLIQNQPSEFQFLNEKLIVDFVNGISVSQDIQNVIKKRTSHSNRFFDAISGKAYLRQAHLNDHVLTGLRACEGWLNNLTCNINEHSVAISQISHSLSKTQLHLAKVADAVIDIRDRIGILNQYTQELVQDVQILKTTDAAKTQLDLVFTSWAAGDLKNYSILEKSYIALDNLYWGNFSKIIGFSDSDDYLKLLRNRLVIQLKNEFGAASEDQIFLREDWLHCEQQSQSQHELLEYLGDWSLVKPTVVPNTFLATQWNTLDDEEIRKPEINHLPFHVADINTVADNLINEFFKVRKNG